MASVKIASLLLRTIAKPMANSLKARAKQHERFKDVTIRLAQRLHASEMHMRMRLLGEDHPRTVRPLNDAKALEQGANFLAESFLFSVAAAIIIAENVRSKRKDEKRRDFVAETLEAHSREIEELKSRLESERTERSEGVARERDLERVVEEIVDIGVKGGWLRTGSTTDDAKWKEHVRIATEARAAAEQAATQDTPATSSQQA